MICSELFDMFDSGQLLNVQCEGFFLNYVYNEIITTGTMQLPSKLQGNSSLKLKNNLRFYMETQKTKDSQKGPE